MTLDEAMDALGTPGDDLPIAAMDVLLGQWDVAGPRCLAMLDDYVRGLDLSEATERALFIVVHLLGEKRETAAFDALCILASDPERADLVLGDAITETLPKILISTFGGETGPLRSLIAQPNANSFARHGALLAMAYLARSGQVADAEMRAWLADLFETMQPQNEDVIWAGWVTAVGMLGYSDLTSQAEAAFARGFVDRSIMEIKHFREDLREAARHPGSLSAFEDVGIAPMGRAADALEGWHLDEEAPVQEPFVNPLRSVGRNDPCPCGSGKKYKKCCLA
jgi:uncharacterized protein